MWLEDFAGTEYTYSVGNRLVRAVQNGVTYGFSYNALGDRLRQTVAGEVSTYTLDLFTGLTQVLWDGENLYLYGLARIGEEQPGGWAYHLADALGSVRQVVDANGDVTLARSFKPYGGLLESEGDGATAYDFAGEWRDAYIKLIYLRSRYYAPYLNQFIQPDPIIPRPENPQDWNKYSYVRNNPVNFGDPSGLWRWALSTGVYHNFIEPFYEGTRLGLGNPSKQLEYSIPHVGTRPDMFNSVTGDIYEIKPWFQQAAAAIQVQAYRTGLLAAAATGSLQGISPFGIPYNWNSTPFRVGTGVDWPGKYRSRLILFPAFDLVADYVGNGTVIQM